MSLSRKHFEAVAAILKEERGEWRSPDAQDAIDGVTVSLAQYFKSENVNFDQGRFENAAGLGRSTRRN